MRGLNTNANIQAITQRSQYVSSKRPSKEDKTLQKQYEEIGLYTGSLKCDVITYKTDFNLQNDKNKNWIKKEAIKRYQSGYSFREVTEDIAFMKNANIKENQIKTILKKENIKSRPPGKDPLPFYIVYNADGPDIEEIEEIVALKRKKGKPEDEIQSFIEKEIQENERVVMKNYNKNSPWTQPFIMKNMARELNMYHSTTRDSVKGLAFETMLAKVLEKSGANVQVFTEGNKGADVAARLEQEEVASFYSLKTESKGNENGGNIEIQSLAPHGYIDVPSNTDEIKEALNNTFDHLDLYQKIIYMQCREQHFPDTKEDASRYNMITLDSNQIKDCLQRVTNKEIQTALGLQTKSKHKTVTLPLKDNEGNILFTLTLGKEHAGFAVVDPSTYQTEATFYTKPPKRFETLQRQVGNKRKKTPQGRKKK